MTNTLKRKLKIFNFDAIGSLFIVIFFSLLISTNANAQGCTCIEFTAFQKDTNRTDEDFFYSQLSQSKKAICLAKVWEWKASRLMLSGQLDSAKVLLSDVENIYNKSGCEEEVRLTLYKYLSGLYYSKSDFSKSLEWGLKFLKLTEQSNNPYELALCNTMISQLFNQMGQADKGITYNRRAVLLLDKINVDIEKESILFKISKRYLWHYQDFKVKSSLDSFEIFAKKQLVVAKKLGIRKKISAGYSNMESVFLQKREYQKGLKYLDSAFFYMDKNDLNNVGVSYYDRASLLLKLNDVRQALRFADSAIVTYKILKSPTYIANTYGLISEIHARAGNFEEAHKTYKMQHLLSDSLTSAKKTQAFQELEKRYSQEKNERKIMDLSQTAVIQSLQIEQRNILLIILICSIVFSTVGIWFFIRQRSIVQQQKELSLEYRFLRFQLNPHFLSNALVSIQRFMLDNNAHLAADYLSRFTRMMRQFLEYSRRDTIAIEDEIEVLKNYVSIQQLGFANGFTFNLIVDETLNMEQYKIPPMFGQPFIENAIEHGIRGMSNGILTVRLLKREEFLLLSIEDNGAGMNSKKLESPNHVSFATTIIRERMELINRGRKEKIRLLISSPETGIGTLVQLWLPIYS